MSESTQDQTKEEPVTEPKEKQEELLNTEPVYKGSEVKKILDEANALKAKLKDIENKQKQKEIEELTKNNEWQKIADMNDQKAKEYEDRYNTLKTALINDKRLSAIKEAALQSGILKEALEDLRAIDLPEVQIETGASGVTVTGTDRAIQRLKATKPHWFSKSVPNINANTPSVTNGSSAITWDDLKKAEADAKKTGKYDNYKELVLKYKSQN